MKLTIWQFLGLVAVLVVGYLIWSLWGKDQDQNGWIRKFNGGITGDDTKNVSTTTSGGTDGADGANPGKPAW